VVQDDEQHGAAAEEDGERVQAVVGYHCAGEACMRRERGTGQMVDREKQGSRVSM
jgi:hypothetical protein